jgi:geranylgeranyl diphosphate synthase, type II
MRYSLLAGGKRIRPVLALATARTVGLEQREVLPLAGAIELIHTYSLIHDDLPAMDDDALRRGAPTCHVKFGEDVAILAGDGLYAEAFRHLLTQQRAAPERLLAAAAELAAATGVNGMVGGQYADVKADSESGPAVLRRLHELKTGRLIGASVLCVLLLTGIEDGARTAPFRRFAAELGVLFQIVDDILDVTGTDDALGKPRGSDERHGKRTYVSEFGIERARELAAESHRMARQALAEVASRAPGTDATAELEGIADFIYTHTS